MPHSSPPIATRTVRAIRRRLLLHYGQRRRDLPWRRSRDAYGIWVSEVMLQQTQVDTVVPRYTAFLQQYPSVQALAAATPEAICEAWAGLGYYRRARYLHRAAQVICDEHGGNMPQQLDALLRLPGIGRYTAGAIASIAFDIAAPIVDGNVERLLSRLYMQAAPLSTPVGRTFFWQQATALVQGEHPGELNQAMMDMGATVCTPRAPRCQRCPLKTLCRAHARGVVEMYPAVKQRAQRTALSVAMAYLLGRGGVWLVRRPLDSRLWPGQWELPSAAGDEAPLLLAARLGVALGPQLTQVTHLLTHRRVTASIYAPTAPVPASSLAPDAAARMWPHPLEAPLSALARRALQAVGPCAARPARP